VGSQSLDAYDRFDKAVAIMETLLPLYRLGDNEFSKFIFIRPLQIICVIDFFFCAEVADPLDVDFDAAMHPDDLAKLLEKTADRRNLYIFVSAHCF
jgi:hypothetical protein